MDFVVLLSKESKKKPKWGYKVLVMAVKLPAMIEWLDRVRQNQIGWRLGLAS